MRTCIVEQVSGGGFLAFPEREYAQTYTMGLSLESFGRCQNNEDFAVDARRRFQRLLGLVV